MTGLVFSQEDIGNAQTGSNWRVLLSYFNLVQILESSGIGLIYGLRFYSIGQLTQEDTTKYIRTNALLYEYYKQAREMIPQDIGKILQKLFTSDEYILVNTRYQLTRVVAQTLYRRHLVSNDILQIRHCYLLCRILINNDKVLHKLNDSNL